MSSANVSASTMRIRMQAKREHERALAQDPSIFDYDAIYDDLQAKKNEKVTEQKAADKERKVCIDHLLAFIWYFIEFRGGSERE